ncbi:unnamed protein product [Arabidopsis lyrata]|nr:unnamed protein product [Arabidopsis lyrata]
MATCGMRRIKLGSQGLEVSAQGFGCAHYGPSKPETDDIALLHHANISGPHTNELLLAKALKDGMREKVVLATKFGCILVKGKRDVRGDPEYVRAACEASLKRLDVSCIDLYYQHRVDARVPIEITVSPPLANPHPCHCFKVFKSVRLSLGK